MNIGPTGLSPAPVLLTAEKLVAYFSLTLVGGTSGLFIPPSSPSRPSLSLSPFLITLCRPLIQ